MATHSLDEDFCVYLFHWNTLLHCENPISIGLINLMYNIWPKRWMFYISFNFRVLYVSKFDTVEIICIKLRFCQNNLCRVLYQTLTMSKISCTKVFVEAWMGHYNCKCHLSNPYLSFFLSLHLQMKCLIISH